MDLDVEEARSLREQVQVLSACKPLDLVDVRIDQEHALTLINYISVGSRFESSVAHQIPTRATARYARVEPKPGASPPHLPAGSEGPVGSHRPFSHFLVDP